MKTVAPAINLNTEVSARRLATSGSTEVGPVNTVYCVHTSHSWILAPALPGIVRALELTPVLCLLSHNARVSRCLYITKIAEKGDVKTFDTQRKFYSEVLRMEIGQPLSAAIFRDVIMMAVQHLALRYNDRRAPPSSRIVKVLLRWSEHFIIHLFKTFSIFFLKCSYVWTVWGQVQKLNWITASISAHVLVNMYTSCRALFMA